MRRPSFDRGVHARVLACLASIAALLGPTASARADCASDYAGARQLLAERRLTAAREVLIACAQPECPDDVQSACTAALGDTERKIASVVFAVTDQSERDLVDVRVYQDDRLLLERADGRAIPIDPGTYRIRFQARGHRALELTMTVAASERNKIVRAVLPRTGSSSDTLRAPAASLQVDRERRHSRSSIAPWIMVGVSGALLVAGGVMTAIAVSESAAVEAAPKHSRWSAVRSKYERAPWLSGAGFALLGVGAAGLAGGLIWHFSDSARPERREGLR